METQEKCFIWDCFDCSDDPPKLTKLCARFRSLDEKEAFRVAFEQAHKENTEVIVQTVQKPEEAKVDKEEQKKEVEVKTDVVEKTELKPKEDEGKKAEKETETKEPIVEKLFKEVQV